MSRTKFEQLKAALLRDGPDAVESFLGCRPHPDEDETVVSYRIDRAYVDMPWTELLRFYEKYGIRID